MRGRRGARRILIAVGLAIALALGGVGTATGSSKAVVTKHYGPLEMVSGQTAQLNATNMDKVSQKFTLTLYDGNGSVLNTSSLTLNAGASTSITYIEWSVGKSTIIRGLTKSANASVDGSLELYDTLANNEDLLLAVAPLLTISGKAAPVGISKSETAVMYVTNLGSQAGTFTLTFFDDTGNGVIDTILTLLPGQTGMLEYANPLIVGRALVRGLVTIPVAGRFIASFGVRDNATQKVKMENCR
jgi:hypothetical protein